MKTTKIDVCKQIISTWGNLPIAKSPKHWIVLLAIACILYSSMQSLTGCKKVQPAKLLGIKLTKEFLVWKMTKVCKYSGPVSENGVIVFLQIGKFLVPKTVRNLSIAAWNYLVWSPLHLGETHCLQLVLWFPCSKKQQKWRYRLFPLSANWKSFCTITSALDFFYQPVHGLYTKKYNSAMYKLPKCCKFAAIAKYI